VHCGRLPIHLYRDEKVTEIDRHSQMSQIKRVQAKMCIPCLNTTYGYQVHDVVTLQLPSFLWTSLVHGTRQRTLQS